MTNTKVNLLSKSRKLDILGVVVFTAILAFGVGLQAAQPWTGTLNTLSDGYMEVDDVNITSEIYWNSLNRTDTLAYPEQAASYIIFKDGSNYCAKNGTTGQIDYSGTNATTVIQTTLDALTSGRTWRERVVLIGDFTVEAVIIVPSHIDIELYGKITMPDNTDTDVWRIWSGKSNIIIRGGRYEMGTQAGGSVVSIDNSDNILIEKIESREGYLPLYSSSTSSNILFRNNRIYDAGIQGINLNGEHIIAENNFISGGCSEYALILGIGAYITAENNWIKGTTTWAIEIGYENEFAVASYNDIDGCGNGLIVIPKTTVNSDLNMIRGVLIHGNKFRDTNRTIRFDLSPDFPLEHILVTENDIEVQDGMSGIDTNFGGVGDVGYLKYVLVYDNKIYEKSGTTIGITVSGTSWRIYENDLIGCDTKINPVNPTWSPDLKMKDNLGYITENSGTQTCANNEDIAHGLAGTPTYVSITPMNDTYDGKALFATVDWSNVDSTNIQVGLYWWNGTAIATDIILVSWSATYEP